MQTSPGAPFEEAKNPRGIEKSTTWRLAAGLITRGETISLAVQVSIALSFCKESQSGIRKGHSGE